MIALPPIALTPGESIAVPIGNNPDLLQGVKLANESPYPIQVTGPGNQVIWIPAWVEDMLLVEEGQSSNGISVIPTQIGTVPTQQISSTLLVTQFQKGDTIPKGQWPAPLARMGIGSSVAANIVRADSNSTGVNATCKIDAAQGLSTYMCSFTASWSNVATAFDTSIQITGLVFNTTVFYYVHVPTTGLVFPITYTPPVQVLPTQQLIVKAIGNGVNGVNLSITLTGYQQ